MSYALQTCNLVKNFGGLVAADNVTLNIEAGARHALIGPNGAGKTTLINLLTGFLRPTAGQVILGGDDITTLAQYQRVKRGLGARWWKPVSAHAGAIDAAAQLLKRLRLADVANERTSNLPYGKQRLIEIALALAAEPRVLLLDEPAAGVPTLESRELFETIAALPHEVTIVLIEHDMDLVFRFADRISVLVSGALLIEDVPDVIARDPRVRQLYLGEAGYG